FNHGRHFFKTQQIEASSDGGERLGKVVNDAMQQDFLFLNFAKKLLVSQQGIAGGLEPLLLFGKMRGEILQNQNLFVIERQSESFERDFAAIFVALGPIA